MDGFIETMSNIVDVNQYLKTDVNTGMGFLIGKYRIITSFEPPKSACELEKKL